MQLLLLFFILAGIANFSGGMLSVVSWFFVRGKYRKTRKGKGKASIIIPLKGKDIENIGYFLNQDYEEYEIIIVVDSKEEADEIKKKYGGARVEISRKMPDCSGKISALLTGIEKCHGDIYAIFMFLLMLTSNPIKNGFPIWLEELKKKRLPQVTDGILEIKF